MRWVPLRLTARRSWVRFLPGEAVGAGGVSHTLCRRCPDPKKVGLAKGAFCVEVACSPRVSSGTYHVHVPPQKNMQRAKAKIGIKTNKKKCSVLETAVQDGIFRDKRQNLVLVGLKETLENGKPERCVKENQ